MRLYFSGTDIYVETNLSANDSVLLGTSAPSRFGPRITSGRDTLSPAARSAPPSGRSGARREIRC
jgi:hypothetical protein